MNVKGKTILITGGSTGIGKAIAKEFISEGAKMIVLGLNKPDYKCDFFRVDLKREEEIKIAFEKIKHVDVVVNNAGIAKILSLKNTGTKDFDEILDTNLRGTFLVCKYASSKMSSGGCFINISSIAGIKGFADYGAYSSSKWGIVGFTKSLALEYASKKIRANCIAPGLIDTPIFGKMVESKKERLKQLKEWTDEIPLKRIGKPEEIAHAARFLVENDFVNGIVLPVDGGESAT